LAPGAQVKREVKLLSQLPHFGIVVALVQTEVLLCSGAGRGTLGLDVFQSFAGQQVVVAIGSGNRHAHGDAQGVGQEAAFDPAFGAVGWVGPGFFPRPGEPWSSPHPSPPSSSQSPPVPRNRASPRSRTAQRPRPGPTLESGGGPRSACKCPCHPGPPTG